LNIEKGAYKWSLQNIEKSLKIARHIYHADKVNTDKLEEARQ
jgi:hypothetical protein